MQGLRLIIFFIGLLIVTGCYSRSSLPCGQETANGPEFRWTAAPYQKFQCDSLPQTPTIPQGTAPLGPAQLIDIALCNNPQTHLAWNQARSAAYGWKSSQSSLYPQVDTSGNICYQEKRCHRRRSENDVIIGGELAASYLLLDFGGRSASIESAYQGLIAANWTQNRVLQEVMLEVLQSYYTYVDAKAQFESKVDDVHDAQANLDAAETLFQAGIKTRVDVLQVKSVLVNTKLELEEIRGAVNTRLGRLATALGLPANTELRIADFPENMELDRVSQDMDQLMAEAKEHRPDLAAAYAEYLQKNADFEKACSEGNPTLSASILASSNTYLHRCGNNGKTYQGCIHLDIPLFHGFYFVNQRRKAKANSDAAYNVLQEKENSALLEVLTSYYSYTTAVETLTYSDEFLKYSKETYEAALSSYKEGLASVLDVLAAQSSLSAARAQRIQARTRWVASLTNLAFATGTL